MTRVVRKAKFLHHPGTAAAIAAGCICPVVDNNRGEGIQSFTDRGEPVRYWWFDVNCPLHYERWVLLPLPTGDSVA